MTTDLLTVHRDGPIEYLTLNRPEVRNAFDDRMIDALLTWADRAAVDTTLRVVVLSGSGPVFSAGADLDWMARSADYSHDENIADATMAARLFERLNSLPAALVGRVHGAALGGGCGLVAICDAVIADERTFFGFSEVKLGIIPAVIAPYVLAKIGQSAARELFLTGRRFPAARAREIGLVHAVTPTSALDAAVDVYVRELLQAAPGAIAAAKSLLGQLAAATPSDTVALTAKAIADRRVSTEGRAGIRAFLDKGRAPWVRP